MRTLVDLAYVSGAALTAAADYTGPSINVWQHVGYSIQAVWTSTSALTGSLKIQSSNDNATWTDLASPQAIAGSSGNYMWNVTDVFYQYVRIFYAHTSGTGTLSANIVAKGV